VIKTQEELDQLEAVDYLREAQAGEPSFCREFSLEHAEVFISATTTDLGSYRGEVKNALLTLGIFPIEQTNFALAHGPLTEVLHGLIGRCDAVIYLAGLHYKMSHFVEISPF
jgi:hypothetical protein